MSSGIDVWRGLKYAFLNAFAFIIPVFFYLHDATYAQTWLLFLGVFLFMIVTAVQTMQDSKINPNEQTSTLIFNSLKITFAGIAICCLLSFLLLFIMVPGYLTHAGHTAKQLAGAPSVSKVDKTGGLSFEIFMTAIVGNLTVGAFAGLLVPFYTSANNNEQPD